VERGYREAVGVYMCGICGVIGQNVTTDVLNNINNTMHHRGPDDSGIYISDFGSAQIGMGHRRLSIIDLTESGHQPMMSDKKDIVVVFNGEIYNYQELKSELQTLGYTFSSTSDTEVIIYGYKAWGMDFVNKLNGMFAIGLLDKNKSEFYLVRDRMGIKPLYYYSHGAELVFASELKPIMSYPGFKKNIDFKVLKGYMQYLNVNAPHTIFKDVFKLEPGQILKYERGTSHIHNYWDLQKVYNDNTKMDVSYEEAHKMVAETIEDAVKKRLISDVPVGTFLSGGIDSTLVTMMAQKNSTKPMSTFSIGFKDAQFNEALYAKEIADYLGTNHHELYIDEADMLKEIHNIPKFYDEPFADSSQIPTMMVSKLAREKVTVSLSGDGGDELFCGYNSYDALNKLERYSKFTALPGALVKTMHLNKLMYGVNWKVGTLLEASSKKGMVNFNYLYMNHLLEGMFVEDIQYDTFYDLPKIDTSNMIESKMLLDAYTYMPNDILTKVDRASMRYSLEARTPLLDHRVVELACRVKQEYKNKNGDKKHILKNIIKQEIPAAMIERPKKGFAVPLNKWLRNDLTPLIEQYTSERYIKEQGIFKIEKIKEIKTRLVHEDSGVCDGILWALLMFQLWYEEYIVN